MNTGYASDLESLVRYTVHGECTVDIAVCEKLSPQTRLDVYRLGYIERLKRVLEADYPATRAYIGVDVFHEIAKAFIHHTPSRYWDLNKFAPNLADFIENLDPPNPALCTLARLEATISQVFWAPDSPPLPVSWLGQQTEQSLLDSTFTMRTASSLLSHPYAADAWICAFRETGMSTHELQSIPEFLCIVRHHNTVRRVALEPAEYTLLNHLSNGMAFGAALEQTALTHDADRFMPHLVRYVMGWLEHGVLQCSGLY